jgi:hypothetical protein
LRLWIRLDTELFIKGGLELAVSSERRSATTERHLDGDRPADKVLAYRVDPDRSIEHRQIADEIAETSPLRFRGAEG